MRRVLPCLLIVICTCFLPAVADEAAPAPGQAVSGLKLTLSADPAVLQMTPRNLRRALADTPRYDCTKAALTLTFTNVSDKPIKLDAYDLTWSRVKVSATGPTAKSVRVSPLKVMRDMAAPAPGDYPTIEPGKSWSAKAQFPGLLGGEMYLVADPGLYRLSLTYTGKIDTNAAARPAFQDGTWVGVVASNAVELVANAPAGEAAYGQPVNGLALGVSVPGYEVAPGEPIKATLTLRNVGEKELLVLPAMVQSDTLRFEVVSPDGKTIPYRGPMRDWDIPDYDAAVRTLKTGEAVSADQSLFGFAMNAPGVYRITATYHWPNAAPPPGRKPAVWNRGPIWTGDATSATFAITVKPKDDAAGDGKQGVEGQVMQLTGDFMPGPGPARGARTPLSVPVHVFKGKVKMFTRPDPTHAQLVRTVQADKDGKFKVALAPGVYTVVAQIGGSMYLNIMTGDGFWWAVTVEAGKWAHVDIKETSGAAF
ncbi:MAG: hypothetical protein BIFFINMI_01882 [Phycisphaerae bacterium]|nr:hypothetical protein [Phycisphaerae bacterium]